MMRSIKKKALLAGTILGILAIVLGAFAAHRLKVLFSVEALESFKTGVSYQQFIALFLLVIPVVEHQIKRSLGIVYRLSLLGVILFSGSIYCLNMNSQLWHFNFPFFLPLLTPIGGLLMIAAFVTLLIQIIKSNSN